MPTVGDWCSAVVFELGGQLIGGPAPDAQTLQLSQALESYVATLWDFYADIPQARLRFLFTLREAAAVLWGQTRTKVSGSLGPVSQQLNQKFTNLKAIIDSATARVEEERKRLRANRGPVVGQLLATSPVQAGRYQAVPDASQPQNALPRWPSPDSATFYMPRQALADPDVARSAGDFFGLWWGWGQSRGWW